METGCAAYGMDGIDEGELTLAGYSEEQDGMMMVLNEEGDEEEQRKTLPLVASFR